MPASFDGLHWRSAQAEAAAIKARTKLEADPSSSAGRPGELCRVRFQDSGGVHRTPKTGDDNERQKRREHPLRVRSGQAIATKVWCSNVSREAATSRMCWAESFDRGGGVCYGIFGPARRFFWGILLL